MTMNNIRENLQRWIDALRSGKYTQGKAYLKTDNRFCCLGVACDISNLGKWDGKSFHIFNSTEIFYTILPSELNIYYGVNQDIENKLIRMNDGGASFEEIADYLEENCLNRLEN